MGALDRRKEEPIDDETTVAGSADAAQVGLGPRDTVDLYYDVAATSDAITIEVSRDGSVWRQHPDTVSSANVSTGGAWVRNIATQYEHIRAYPGSGFADGDVNIVEISGK